MMSMLESLRESVRLADVIDIALVSLFFYALLMWFKSTGSRQILIGVGVLAVVYLIARAFDMYMTVGLFQTGLAFAAIAAIVVFQEDLRRGFSRIAALGGFSRHRSAPSNGGFDVLVETMFALAKKKVGALLVVRGTEHLDRHVRGGVIVDARISKALLDSIFDPHSMGHDGAVIIDRERILQFAAHLPLSRNSAEIGERGTRHSAALGLSELCDALVVVVSEERGEVSVAEAGKLTRVTTPMELKKRLDPFAGRTPAQNATSLRRRLIREHPWMKVISVGAAGLAWFLISFQAETVQKTFIVPVEYRNLRDAFDIDDSAPTEMRITLSGFDRAFNLLAPNTLKVSIDLSGVDEGTQQIVIDETQIKLPSNLALYRTWPRIISFGVHSWVKTRVAVTLRTEGRLPRDLRQKEIIVLPETVPALVWRSMKASVTHLETEPVDLGRITDTGEFRARLVIPQHIRLEVGQAPDVRLKLVNTPEMSTAGTSP